MKFPNRKYPAFHNGMRYILSGFALHIYQSVQKLSILQKKLWLAICAALILAYTGKHGLNRKSGSHFNHTNNALIRTIINQKHRTLSTCICLLYFGTYGTNSYQHFKMQFWAAVNVRPSNHTSKTICGPKCGLSSSEDWSASFGLIEAKFYMVRPKLTSLWLINCY